MSFAPGIQIFYARRQKGYQNMQLLYFNEIYRRPSLIFISSTNCCFHGYDTAKSQHPQSITLYCGCIMIFSLVCLVD